MNFSYFSKIILILSLVLLLGAGCTKNSYLAGSNTGTTPSGQNSTQSQTSNTNPANTSEGRFTGTIQAVKNEMPVDGSLALKIDGKWVEVNGGSMFPLPARGKLIGLSENADDLENSIGTKVEVYAQRVSGNGQDLFTLFGSTDYYVKVVK